MKKIVLLTLLTILWFFSFSQENQYQPIKIRWSNNLTGDFSFKKKWSYPAAVDKNAYGELTCDGLCPDESYAMLDDKGRIKKKYIKAYYKLVDTTHQFHSIQCEGQGIPGWSGTDFMEIEQKQDTIYGYTLAYGGQYSSLHLTITKDNCFPEIEFISPVRSIGNSGAYKCTDGFIKIDKNLWKKGVMKAEFDFTFRDPKYPEQNMSCKGKIYAKIKK